MVSPAVLEAEVVVALLEDEDEVKPNVTDTTSSKFSPFPEFFFPINE